MPGCIAATPVEGPIDVEEGMPIDLPLVFCYGHQTSTENPELYRAIVERLSDILDKRVSEASAEAGVTPNIIIRLASSPSCVNPSACNNGQGDDFHEMRDAPHAIMSAAWREVQDNVDVHAAGLIVNTMGFIEGLGYELLLHAITAFRADVVLVLGQERLFNQLRTHLK